MDGCLHWLTDYKLITRRIHSQGQTSCHIRTGGYLLQPVSREAGLSFQSLCSLLCSRWMHGWTILQLWPKSTLHITFNSSIGTQYLNGSTPKCSEGKKKTAENFLFCIFPCQEPYLLGLAQSLKTVFSSERWNCHLTEILTLVFTSIKFTPQIIPALSSLNGVLMVSEVNSVLWLFANLQQKMCFTKLLKEKYLIL